MTDDKRRCLAFLYASILRPTKSYRNLYDHQTNLFYFYIITQKSDDNIMVFDHSRGGYMGGSLPNIFDFVSASYVSMQQIKPELRCYDYEKGCFIQGNMEASTVTLYDYETGLHYNYLIT